MFFNYLYRREKQEFHFGILHHWLVNKHNDHKQNEPSADICDALRDLVPFVQYKKCEKHHAGALLLVKLQAESLQLY